MRARLTKACPIFICGVGRSGTTILSKVIGEHDHVYRFNWETRFLVDPGGLIDLNYALCHNWSPYVGNNAVNKFKELMFGLCEKEHEFTSFFAKGSKLLYEKTKHTSLLWAPSPYKRVGLGKEIGIEHMRMVVNKFLCELIHDEYEGIWCGAKAGFNPTIINSYKFDESIFIPMIRNFMEELFSPLIKNKRFWIDHTPFTFLHMPDIKNIYPESKIVVIIRDPRDTISSYLNMEWGGNDVSSVSHWVYNVYSKWSELKKTVIAGHDYFELKLEDLISHRDQSLVDLSNYLEIDITPSMKDVDLTEGHMRRWETDLDSEDKSMLNELFGSFLQEYGYDSL